MNAEVKARGFQFIAQRSAFIVKDETEVHGMAAYIVVEVDVRDKERYEDYKRMVPPTLAQYGGRFVVRGGAAETLEGDWSPGRVVIVEFPSAEQAKAWWNSPEYAPAKELRQATAHTQMILVEGV